jgi:nitrogen-specific signal transduction histidine kinase
MEIIRDITQEKEQEQQRLELNRQKEQLKKLASLKTMAGSIAHRFNNAMTVVQGNLQLLDISLPDLSKEHMMASNAFQAARGASQVGSMMLSYVGQQPLNLRKESLSDIVRESVHTLNSLFHSAIILKFNQLSDPLYCSIDRQQIKEVIENVLTNAVESLDNGSGTIEITFGTDYFTANSFPISFQDHTLQDGLYSFCQIKDTGHGVSLENLPKVFEPFYTTRFIGRGLGLSLTVGIMQAHQGAITFESTPGSGTTVRILLPYVESSSQQAVFNSDDVKAPVVRLSGNILLVDDEPHVLEVDKKILEMLGFTVHTAVNGKVAVSKVSRQDINFSAIVMDVSMPEMDGIEAMEAIRQIDSSIPILLSSGYSEADFPFEENRLIKPDGFLGKPFQIPDLQHNLEKLLSNC